MKWGDYTFNDFCRAVGRRGGAHRKVGPLYLLDTSWGDTRPPQTWALAVPSAECLSEIGFVAIAAPFCYFTHRKSCVLQVLAGQRTSGLVEQALETGSFLRQSPEQRALGQACCQRGLLRGDAATGVAKDEAA